MGSILLIFRTRPPGPVVERYVRELPTLMSEVYSELFLCKAGFGKVSSTSSSFFGKGNFMPCSTLVD
jgi:hypothetical protein